MALLKVNAKTLGVESLNTTEQAEHIARDLAHQYGMTVAISGQKDFITNGEKHSECHYGSSMMPFITGMGCLLTAVIAAFRAVIDNPFEAGLFRGKLLWFLWKHCRKNCTGPRWFSHSIY